MQAQLQSVEVEFVILHNDQFPVEHTPNWQCGAQRVKQFREIAVQRLLVAALDQDLLAVTEHQRAKSIPFGLVDPVAGCGQRIHALGKHR
jgi:hypothetical protein